MRHGILALIVMVGLGVRTSALAQQAVGDWQGTLHPRPEISLRLAVHIHGAVNGTLEGEIDSLDQGAMGIKLAHIAATHGTLAFEIPAVHGAYAGAWNAEADGFVGRWHQGGQDLPLTLTPVVRGTPRASLDRPQTPHPPYPYVEEQVAFFNASAHIPLAGTLTRPEGQGPFPAVVLIAGSGPNTRDEPIFGHKPFLVLADHLSRRGIVVLRYDKRGVGKSGGDYATATSLDFATDAQAAFDWLVHQPGVDPQRVGLIGHSEGGLIAPMVAASDSKVAFIVLLAGPGVDGAALLAEQGRLISRAMGVNEADSAAESNLREKMIAIVRAEADPKIAANRLKTVAAQYGAAHDLSAPAVKVLDAQYAAINTAWFRQFFDYDPAPTLTKLRIPVLALIGSKDLQVPPDQNLPALRSALAGDPLATVEELPGLNHLFQTATSGAVSEYGQIHETLAPAALKVITDWILNRKPA